MALEMRLIIILLAVFSASCSSNDNYTLYRNSVMDSNMRIHVASFDTNEKGGYNQENCFLAAELFQKQDGVQTKFWCEKGNFKK